MTTSDLVILAWRRVATNTKPKLYYAHFLRLKAKAGTILQYRARFVFGAPIPVADGVWKGGRFTGVCRVAIF